jgi:hypothetical protein
VFYRINPDVLARLAGLLTPTRACR